MFYDLSHQRREKIALTLGKTTKVKRGMKLFSLGDSNIDGVYLILKGEFEVLKVIDFDGLSSRELKVFQNI